jgi:soluble lytic murein transglycosylase
MPRFCREIRKLWLGKQELRISSILPAEEVLRNRWRWVPQPGGSELVKASRLIVALPALVLAVGQLHAAQTTDAVPLPTSKPAALKPSKGKPIEPKAQAKKRPSAPISLTPTVSHAPVTASAPNAPIRVNAAPQILPGRPVPIPSLPPAPAFARAASVTTSPLDLAAVKQAFDLAHRGRTDEATNIEATISDPVARKLVEWLILRSDDTDADFSRYSAFIAANPSWPSVVSLRRRAESVVWQDHTDPATVIAFFRAEPPRTAKGKFALARAFLARGDSAAAQQIVSESWRDDGFSADVEAQARDAFVGLITPADDKARMDARLYAEDDDGGLRAAQHLDAVALAIAKARAAVFNKDSSAKMLLEAVPAAAQHDAGYIFSRIQWLRHEDKIDEAGRLMATAPRDPAVLHDVDQWWVERRLVARKLLDLGDVKMAYAIANDAATPVNENYRAEQQFTAGWIALRFLHEPAIALAHFARIADNVSNPITLARSFYWQGRAAEAAGREQDARSYYETAASYPTAYYGQLARARLGLDGVVLQAAPAAPDLRGLEVARAFEILYAIDARDIVAAMAADLADKATDTAALATLAEIATRHDRQDRARARPAARAICLSRFWRAGFSADRPAGRALRHLFDRAPGKRFQPESRVQRQRARPDASHARGRPRYRETIQRHVRSAAPDVRRRLQRPTRHRRTRQRHCELARLLHPGLRRL